MRTGKPLGLLLSRRHVGPAASFNYILMLVFLVRLSFFFTGFLCFFL